MRHGLIRWGLTAVLAFTASAPTVFAVETSAVGSQTNQANVDVLNSKIDSLMASMQAMLNGVATCNAQRKFYAPSDPKKDANSCVGVGDYDLNMANGNNVVLASGKVSSTNAASGVAWGGVFKSADYGVLGLTTDTASGVSVWGQNPGAGTGVYGQSLGSGTGVVGYSANGMAGSFSGSGGIYASASGNGQYGVRGTSANSWGGYFDGALGVYAHSGNNTSLAVDGGANNNWVASIVGNSYGLVAEGPQQAFMAYNTATTNTCNPGTGAGCNWTTVIYGGISPYGLDIYNANNNALLCLNGTCVTSLSSGSSYRYGGDFTMQNSSCWNPNTYTGGCSCPSGFNGHHNIPASPYGQSVVYTFYSCYN